MGTCFAVTRTDLADAIVLTVTGSLDAFTAPACDQAMVRVLAAVAPGRLLLLDLRRLDFLAATGVRTLSRTVEAARRASIPIRVVVGPGQSTRLILDRIDVDARIPVAGRLAGPDGRTPAGWDPSRYRRCGTDERQSPPRRAAVRRHRRAVRRRRGRTAGGGRPG
ncbi:STAS domain-containing protein [Hamadaea tsunoensis]|uniref:STAS domain-containing protein n=1 Tax=Hamadaea tsunoensis TaxID=53368 RepID=UPI00041E363D|nr:STAS domain-containing protein [Hamadaea tsunoensis]